MKLTSKSSAKKTSPCSSTRQGEHLELRTDNLHLVTEVNGTRLYVDPNGRYILDELLNESESAMETDGVYSVELSRQRCVVDPVDAVRALFVAALPRGFCELYDAAPAAASGFHLANGALTQPREKISSRVRFQKMPICQVTYSDEIGI